MADDKQRFVPAIKAVTSLDGAIVEVGVAGGGSAKELRRLFPAKRLHLFDTFCGLPKEMYDANIDKKYNLPGGFAHTVESVKKNWVAPAAYIFMAGCFQHQLRALTSLCVSFTATLITTHRQKPYWNIFGIGCRLAGYSSATITGMAPAQAPSWPATNFLVLARTSPNRCGTARCA